MDHKAAKDEGEMRYLKRPRGDGSGYVFRMITPEALKGKLNPRTGKPFGREIKLGLNTRHLPTARQRRDVVLGELRALELGQEELAPFSLQAALDWRSEIADARERDPSGHEADTLKLVLLGRLEDEAGPTSAEDKEVGRRVPPNPKLQRFARVAYGKGFLLQKAQRQYIEERSPGNSFNFKPIKPATVKELGIALGHLCQFLGDAEGFACMEDVTADQARRFRQECLPSIISKQTKAPMSARTADKYITMLRPMWDWAVTDRQLTAKRYKVNPWVFGRSVPRAKKSDNPSRQAFTAEDVRRLLAATTPGTRGGDAFRMSLATGVRINELVLLQTQGVEADGSGFHLRTGKTQNATRYIPLVGAAADVCRARLSAHRASGRLFPEWPVKPSTGRCGAVTRWFIDFRRKVLGVESDGRVVLHSTRHTWRTMARRAGVSDATTNDLGGWAGPRTSSSVYDHRLLREQLQEAQQMVWAELERGGYLEGF